MNTTVADTCHCIVRHPDKAKFLVVKHEEEDWSPPVLMFPPRTVDDDASLVNQGMLDKYGLKTRVLRSIMNLPNYHCIELELAHVQASKKIEAVWVDKAEYMRSRTPPGDIADPFELWFDEQESAQAVANRPPFQQPGWFNKADHWIHFKLDSLGFQVTGSVEQLVQSVNPVCVLRVPTSQGWAYFKTSQEALPGEAALVDALARRWPGTVLKPLAIDAGRNWILNRELPEHATDIDASMLPGFVRSLAQLQVKSAGTLNEWKALGCRQVSLEDLASFCSNPGPHKALLQEGGGGLTDQEWDMLPATMQSVAAACKELAGFGLPMTLVPAHFHQGKLGLVDDQHLLLDWSETVISHPFLALLPLLQGNRLQALTNGASGSASTEEELRQQLSEAYLQAFGEHGSQEDLQRALDTTRKLGIVWNLTRGIDRVAGLELNSPQYYRSVVGMQAELKQFIRRNA